MTLPNMDQLLENALEHPLFLRLMESRVHGEHPVFCDNKFFPARSHDFKLLHYVAGGQEDNNDLSSCSTCYNRSMSIPKRRLGKTGINVTIVGRGGEGILRTYGHDKEAYGLISKAIDFDFLIRRIMGTP